MSQGAVSPVNITVRALVIVRITSYHNGDHHSTTPKLAVKSRSIELSNFRLADRFLTTQRSNPRLSNNGTTRIMAHRSDNHSKTHHNQVGNSHLALVHRRTFQILHKTRLRVQIRTQALRKHVSNHTEFTTYVSRLRFRLL